jgi:hypothetical protein
MFLIYKALANSLSDQYLVLTLLHLLHNIDTIGFPTLQFSENYIC